MTLVTSNMSELVCDCSVWTVKHRRVPLRQCVAVHEGNNMEMIFFEVVAAVVLDC
jgi:hypothetical protein